MMMMNSSPILASILVIFALQLVGQTYQQTLVCSYQANTISYGQVLGTPAFASSITDCCTRCSQTSGCVAWTYSGTSGQCYLQCTVGTYYRCYGKYSGCNQVTSTTSTTTTTTALVARVCSPIAANYPGGDIVNQQYGSVPTADDCCNLCGSIAGCTLFSYSQANQFCWLKNPTITNGNTPALTADSTNPDFISGILSA